MWVAVVIVASIGLSNTLGHPTSGETLDSMVDTKTLKNPSEPAECKVICGKENEINNHNTSKENTAGINSATDINNINTTSSNKPIIQEPLSEHKPSVVQSPSNALSGEFISSGLHSSNATITDSSTTNKEISKYSFITSKDSSIKSNDSYITSKNSSITRKDSTITSKDYANTSKDCSITSKDSSITNKDSAITSTEASSHLSDDINPTPTECTCVAYFLCNDSFAEFIENRTHLEIPLPECPHSLQTCCFNVDISEELTTKSTNVVSLTEESPLSLPSSTVTLSPSTSTCGKSTVMNSRFQTGDPETIAGGQAEYGEFPWMVWIGDSSLSTLCGGSLIHPKVVLTGAHCVSGKEDIVIRAGEWDTQTQAKEELFPHQELKVTEVVVHEKFNQGSLANDPALLILEAPVNLTEYVGLVCLPESEEDFNGRQCFTSGWGKPPKSEEVQSSILKRVLDLPIVSRGECQEALRKTKLGERFRLHETFICAGGIPGKDTCKGDGGSPLVCSSRTDPLVNVQAGIVAWGISCGTDTPGVYVNVAHFVPWIKDQMKAKGLS